MNNVKKRLAEILELAIETEAQAVSKELLRLFLDITLEEPLENPLMEHGGEDAGEIPG